MTQTYSLSQFTHIFFPTGDDLQIIMQKKRRVICNYKYSKGENGLRRLFEISKESPPSHRRRAISEMI